MALDALLPVGGELTMLFAGALAAGAITGQHPVLLGHQLQTGLESYLVLATAGTLGYLFGSLVGWAIGRWGGRAAARAPRALAARDAREPRARRALVRPPRARRGLPRAPHAGRALLHLDPGRRRSRARSARTPLLTLAGSAIWCFGFAAVGWALGSSYEQVHHAFRYVDVLAVAGAVAALAAVLVLRRRRARA